MRKITREFKTEAQTGNDGEYETWSIEVQIELDADENYGADSDGNRGSEAIFIHSTKILSASREPNGIEATADELKILQPSVDDLVTDLELE